MKIINKYVLKEHVGPLLFALAALTSLLLLNYVAKQFGNLVGKGLPWSVIGEFFLLSIPFTVAMTLPMAVLVATLYAFSRLAAEHEITAFKASGVSMRRLLLPVLLAASVLSIGMIAFNDQVLPRANHRLSILQSDIFRKKPTFALRPQVTNRVGDRLWIRAGHIDPGSNRMRDVVIYDLANADQPRTVYADSGTLALLPNLRDLELVLFHGHVREFPREQSDAGVMPGLQLQRTFFTRDRIIVREVGNELERSQGGSPKSDREMTVCEMQQQYTEVAERYVEARQGMEAAAEQLRAEGKEVSLPRRHRVYVDNGLGALYCRFLDAARERLQPRTAQAAALAAAPPMAQGPPMAQEPAMAQEPTPMRVPRLRPSFAPPPGDSADTTRADASGAGATGAGAAGDTLPGGGVLRDSGFIAPVTDPEAIAPPRRVIPPSAGGAEGYYDMQLMNASLYAGGMHMFDVEIHKKFALAVACVVFVLLGAPIALRFPRGGVGLVIGVSLAVFALYYVCLIAGETVADKGIVPPYLAMWAANVVFTSVGLALLARMGREGGSARGGDVAELTDAARAWLAGVGRRVGVRADRRRRVA